MSDEKNDKTVTRTALDEQKLRYEEKVRRMQKRVRAQVSAIRKSRRVSHKDLQIVINARG